MAEEVQVTPGQESRDLSAGSLPRHEEMLQTKILEYHTQRKAQRSGIFAAVLTFCAVMTLAFLIFVYELLCLTTANGGIVPDWHLLLLGTGLILPPTIVLFALMRRVYSSSDDGSGASAAKVAEPETPSAELLSGVSDVLQKVVQMVTEISGKKS